MFIFGNLFVALSHILDIILTFAYWLILIRALISWVNPDPYNPIVRFLHSVTIPVYYKLKRVLPFPLIFGGIDLTPLVVIAIIYFLEYALVANLMRLGQSLL